MPPDERLNFGASKPPTALVALSLLVSVLAALFSLRSYSIATPPRFDSGWIVSWIVAGGSSAFALAVSKRAGIGGRIILGFAAILSLVAFGVPTMCYFENFMDMPPLAVFPFALLHAVIGWKSNQKIIGLLPLALGTAMFFGARQSGVPLVRQQQGDLVLESFSADSDGNTFHLSSASGKTIRAAYDWRAARIDQPSIGPLLPHLRGRLFLPFRQDADAGYVELNLIMRIPSWARSWSGNLIIPMFPEKPDLSVIATPKGVRRVLVEGHHLSAAASDFRWIKTAMQPSTYRFRLTCSNRRKDLSFRALDEVGLVYDLEVERRSDLPAGTYDLEIADTEGREIRVDVFTEKSRELVFPLDHIRRPA